MGYVNQYFSFFTRSKSPGKCIFTFSNSEVVLLRNVLAKWLVKSHDWSSILFFIIFFSFSSSLDSLVNAHFHFTLPSVVFWQAKAFHNHFQSNASCQRRRLDIGYSHIWYWACQPEAWVRYVNDDFLLTSNHPLNGNPYWNQDFHTLFSFHVLLD